MSAGVDNSRVLLVHPLGYAPQAAGRDISRLANIMPPLGLASLAAYLEQHGMCADIIDCFAHPDSQQAIDGHVRKLRPGFVGFTCTTAGFLDAVRHAERIKRINPETRFVFGGHHVSALREQTLDAYPMNICSSLSEKETNKYSVVDYVVVGEGERPLLALMQGKHPEKIPGLVWRDNTGVRFAGFQDASLELDSLPFPAYEKLAGYPAAYQLPIFNYPATPNASCISSRGCCFQCSYCDRSVFRRSFRFNSAEYLFAHVLHLHRRFGVRHINFYDDHFAFHRGRVEAFCERMIEARLPITFNCASRAEHLDPELLRLMKRAGCWMISLGIESGDPDILKMHRHNPSLENHVRAIQEIHDAGIRVKGLLMIGLPGETEASFRRTMEFVFSLPIDDFNLAKFTPFPGAPLYEKIHELGTFHEDWEKMDCMHFQFIPRGMTEEQLQRLFTEFYKRHFMRPRILLDYVAMLWRSPDSWRRFILNLGSFLSFARTDQRIQGG